ncbi:MULTISPECIES: hypothetical protein [Proteiniphilum]|uniref:hypothetical protein n=1 Tax=Proteiniphilum TaxID=294702 RepID=UPI001EEA796F|nr:MULTISPECIES: hypothetical protein [Proteiniphilum]ULB33745.1 hypothetical protein KDN43_12175 [Proteiniphilum propionicum]
MKKQKYDYKMYVPQPGDKHNPIVMGFSSYFVPGLGQMLSGEVGRGLAFLGGTYIERRMVASKPMPSSVMKITNPVSFVKILSQFYL